MATKRPDGGTDSGGPAPSSAPPPPPNTWAIFVTYLLLGTALSFAFGREPGTVSPDIVREICPTVLVVCLFITSYSLWDVMAVGIAKARHGFMTKPYGSLQSHPPEEVYFAMRAQSNQVEQMPGFIVASLSFSLFVNGKVGAVLALLWAVLRRLYASCFRASVGKTFNQIGLSRFTIPAYFIVNSMLMGTAVQCARSLSK